MLRRLKAEVLAQLPPKRRQVVRLPAPAPGDWPPSGRDGEEEGEEEGTAGDDASSASSEEGPPAGRRMRLANPEGGLSGAGECSPTGRARGGGRARAQAAAARGRAAAGRVGVGAGSGSGREGDAAPAPGAAMSAAHRTGVAKLPNVVRWLVTALGGGEPEEGAAGGAAGAADGAAAGDGERPKFIVFAHHRTVMARLAAALDGDGGSGRGWAGVPFVAIDGSTDAVDRRCAARRPGASSTERARRTDAGQRACCAAGVALRCATSPHAGPCTRMRAASSGAAPLPLSAAKPLTRRPRGARSACARFRDDRAVRVALLSVTAAGTGLDFSAASAVVFAELPDEVALVRQARPCRARVTASTDRLTLNLNCTAHPRADTGSA